MATRCFACMNPMEGHVCPHCGTDLNTIPDQLSFLKPGTLLGGGKYLVGVATERNGEGVTYLGYHEEAGRRIRIREFFPYPLSKRLSDHQSVQVVPGQEITFKALMTDFGELSRQLCHLPGNCSVLRCEDVFSENGTLYAVYEDVEGVPLTTYLRENGGTLTWEETESLFLPLIYTVKVLNGSGVTHCGISPETILVTSQHELRLWGISTSALRASNSEIKSDLAAGYAAPEQYQKCTGFGEWTDVYGISAVLYRTLTGAMPPKGDSNQPLVKPHELDSSIPSSVSEAIAKGLVPAVEQRTPSVSELLSNLYAQKPETAEPVRQRRSFRPPLWLVVILVTLPLLLGMFFLLYFVMLGGQPGDTSSVTPVSRPPVSSSLPSSSTVEDPVSSESVPSIVMDNLEGQFYEDVLASTYYQSRLTFLPVEEVYDDTVPIGYIISQSIPANTVIPQGSEVAFTVSMGARFVQLPPLLDDQMQPISADDYQKHLEEQGFLVKREYTLSYLPSGEIVNLNFSPSEVIDRSVVKEIIMYIAY